MIVFASTLLNARRPRRIPSIASVVRALGTVRVTDQPDAWPTCSTQTTSRSPRGFASHGDDQRGQASQAPLSS